MENAMTFSCDVFNTAVRQTKREYELNISKIVQNSYMQARSYKVLELEVPNDFNDDAQVANLRDEDYVEDLSNDVPI